MLSKLQTRLLKNPSKKYLHVVFFRGGGRGAAISTMPTYLHESILV